MRVPTRRGGGDDTPSLSTASSTSAPAHHTFAPAHPERPRLARPRGRTRSPVSNGTSPAYRRQGATRASRCARRAAAARRLIIASTSRRSSARPVSRRAFGSMVWKERHLRLLDPARLNVGVEGRYGPVVGRHVVPLPALLVEPEPHSVRLPEVVLPPHPEDRAHPREAVEHHREQFAVPEPGQGARVDRREELPRLRRRENPASRPS